jgi:hypothetical protein
MSTFLTIVSGLPRSGTSLMMQMLAAGGMPILTDGMRGADEDNPRGYFEFEPVKRTRQDPSWVAAAQGKAVKMVYLLLRDMPPAYEYRVVMMHRDLREVVASQRVMLLRAGRKGAGVGDDRMAAIFDEQLKSAAAWLAAQSNFRALDVDHRDCLQSPAMTAARINTFLGGALDEGEMSSVVDESLYRQRC